MKKIAILGGSRFIGYHLTQALLQPGFHVSLFNRGKTVPPAKFLADVRIVNGDRNKPWSLKPFFDCDYDVLFDLSGYVPAQVRPVLEGYSSRIGHYVFCSTSSVLALPPPVPFDENSPLCTTPGSYGGDKARVEEILLEASRKFGLPVTILRPQGVLGRYDAAQAAFVFSRLRNNIPIAVREDSRGIRANFVDVKDLVKAFISAANQRVSQGKIYNVANDEPVSLVEFISLCGEACSILPRIHFFDDKVLPDEYRKLPYGVPWHDYDLVSDNGRIKKDLDVRFSPFRNTLEDIWAWLRDNPRHLNLGLSRGERYILENRSIPRWVTVQWSLGCMRGLRKIKNLIRKYYPFL